MVIDLRSDTVTSPCPGMRKAMAAAKVGDDVYGEDPTVLDLEKYASSLLAKPAAVFAPSGTQSNLIALLTHCARGDEYIVGREAHTYKYEGGGAAALGGIQPNPLKLHDNGTFCINELRKAIKPKDMHFAKSRLVCLENTYAGHPIPLNYPGLVKQICQAHELAFHLDGARIFNAACDAQVEAKSLANSFDSVSVCLSKGLGAPVGSILLGSEEFIENARRWRKVLGGGMRQAGVIAAAGLFALKNNLDRLVEDHEKALEISHELCKIFGVEHIRCQTNMVHLDINEPEYSDLAKIFRRNGIIVGRPRWVFHKDISTSNLRKIKQLLVSFRSK